jgi:hypothetical protein
MPKSKIKENVPTDFPNSKYIDRDGLPLSRTWIDWRDENHPIRYFDDMAFFTCNSFGIGYDAEQTQAIMDNKPGYMLLLKKEEAKEFLMENDKHYWEPTTEQIAKQMEYHKFKMGWSCDCDECIKYNEKDHLMSGCSVVEQNK